MSGGYQSGCCSIGKPGVTGGVLGHEMTVENRFGWGGKVAGDILKSEKSIDNSIIRLVKKP
jgi:hypothetical protein